MPERKRAMGSKLSQKLIKLGFFFVLDTYECSGPMSEGRRVKRGQPNTQDCKNGVMVVYDEEGRPWIMRGSKVDDTVRQGLGDFNLSRGAYVPHSNDGGHFVCEVAKL